MVATRFCTWHARICLSMATHKLCMQPDMQHNAHWQIARGYWFERMAHQALSDGASWPFRLLGSHVCYTLQLPRADAVMFKFVKELKRLFKVDSMATYAQPKYSNHPTFDALNCGAPWFQVK